MILNKPKKTGQPNERNRRHANTTGDVQTNKRNTIRQTNHILSKKLDTTCLN